MSTRSRSISSRTATTTCSTSRWRCQRAMTAPRLPRADRGVREVLRIADIGFAPCAALLTGFDLDLQAVADSERIPGSYWGECEAGLIGNTVYARADTPIDRKSTRLNSSH